MWVTYFFLSYLILALAIPLALSLVPLWRAANASRCLRCPEASKPVTVRLDPWYAVKMRLRGDRELRLRDCTEWPARAHCARQCMEKIGAIR